MTDADRLADLQQELYCLLNRRDPTGVFDESLDFRPDEDDCIIGPASAQASSGMVPDARNQL